MKTVNISNLFLDYGLNLMSSLFIAVCGLLLTRFVCTRLRNYLNKHSKEPTVLLFIVNATYGVLLTILAIVVLSDLGVPTGSLLTILGARSIAIGLALKSSLSNIANGLLLVFLKPFKIGDYIEIGGSSGTVSEINLFTTKLKSPNNEAIYLPNTKVLSDRIKNYTKNGKRRIDITIGISYDSDIIKAKQIILDLMEQDDKILSSPESKVTVKELADSAVNLAVRPWVNHQDFGAVSADLLEKIKYQFDANHIAIPFPQMTIQLSKENSG